MALDGIVLHSIVYELHTSLVGGRVDKIFQPDRQSILLHVRQPGKNLRLLLCGDPQQARVQLTDVQFENPLTPPAYCMLLRKHLEGGRIMNVKQQQLDRIVHLTLENWDEVQGLTTRTLVVEIMGKHSNIILLNNQDIILDALYRIPGAVNRHREILPGRRYIAPPAQQKQHPFTADAPSVCSNLAALPQQKTANALVQSFIGLGPGTAREIVTRAGLPPDSTALSLSSEQQTHLAGIFVQFMSGLQHHDYQPTVVLPYDGGGVIDFACYDLLQYPDTSRRHYPSMGQAMDFFFRAERIKSTPGKEVLLKLLRNEKNRAERKILIQQEELQEAHQAEELKILGDLLTANIGLMHKGQKEVTVLNYYDPAQTEITVSLDPKLSPIENTQHYYHRYAKAKRSIDILERQIDETRMEINYLDALLVQLGDALMKADLQEIRLELSEQGYLPPIAPGKKNKRPAAAPAVIPLRFLSPDGWEIFVGKNNKQNDYVTFKLGRGQDIWLHTKDIPGSHVILRVQHTEIPPDTLGMAAKLAAYFSKSRTSSQVPVDYTLRKHVRKPSGAKPGFVIYDQQHTLYVTPDEKIAEIASRPQK
jgi:predicted ribosome quality control (RQC) complex YloA/Tae2 family protein